MKKTTLITAVIAILMLTTVAYSKTVKPYTADELATKMVDKLSADVALTYGQKNRLQIKATDFAIKMQEANLNANKEEAFALRKKASDEYQATVDSIFTPEQKEKFSKKQKERKEAAVSKTMLKNK